MRRLIGFVTVIVAMVVLTRGTASAQQPACSWPLGEAKTQNALLAHAQQWQQEATTRGNRDPVLRVPELQPRVRHARERLLALSPEPRATSAPPSGRRN